MESQDLKSLFKAIKSDDVVAFAGFIMQKNELNISFGRFPILSLCYLYNSKNILSKFEKQLMPVHNFVFVDEYFEIYKDFKKYAKKCLKFYVHQNKTVYPIEMLALLDDRNAIANKYKFLYKNEEIVQNLHKIYNFNYKIQINADLSKFECQAKKMTGKQKLIVAIMSFVSAIIFAFSFCSITFVKNTFGVGTASAPIKISSEAEFNSALKNKNKYYVLTNDIELLNVSSVNNFSGTIDGSGYTITYPENYSNAMITNLSGIIKNLNIKISYNNYQLSKNFAVITEKLSGTLDNITISGDFNVSNISSSAIYLTGFALESSGKIINCISSVNANIFNSESTNCYYFPIAIKNTGTILNTRTEKTTIDAETTYVSGIVLENYGTLENVINNADINVTSSSRWHPNVAGIAIVNAGEIKHAQNKGVIHVNSSLALSENETGSYNIYVGGIVCSNSGNVCDSINAASLFAEGKYLKINMGGIVCENYSSISNCKNQAKLSAKSERQYVYVGGIATYNQSSNMTTASINNSKSEAELVAHSDGATAYVGGISMYNSSLISNSGCVGKLSATSNIESTESAVYIKSVSGGIAAQNESGRINSCYSDVSFALEYKDIQNGILNAAISAYATSGSLSYITNNHYVKDSTVKYAVLKYWYEYITIFYPVIKMDEVEDSETGTKSYDTFDEIPQEVLVNE